MEKMKTLTIQGTTFEIVDEQARTDIEAIPQADWNQNDPTKPDYVKNRPFYTEEAEEVILSETTFTDCTEQPNPFTATKPFEEGMTYVVMWNGIKYECVAFYVDGFGGCAIGNMASIGGENTGEPFAILTSDSISAFVIDDGSTTVTMSIHKVTEVVHKLDAKYLPDGIGGGGGDDIVIEISSAVKKPGNITADHLSLASGNYADVCEKLSTGKPCNARFIWHYDDEGVMDWAIPAGAVVYNGYYGDRVTITMVYAYGAKLGLLAVYLLSDNTLVCDGYTTINS